MMRTFPLTVVLVGLVACGPKQPPKTGPSNDEPVGKVGPVKDSRTAIEKRRDTACEQLQPRLTECAIEDAKKSMTPAEYKKLDPEALRGKHKQEFLKQCEGSSMSSRQVRVLEICFKEEHECDPLAQCLANLNPQPAK
jgi:hypothetical protein